MRTRACAVDIFWADTIIQHVNFFFHASVHRLFSMFSCWNLAEDLLEVVESSNSEKQRCLRHLSFTYGLEMMFCIFLPSPPLSPSSISPPPKAMVQGSIPPGLVCHRRRRRRRRRHHHHHHPRRRHHHHHQTK